MHQKTAIIVLIGGLSLGAGEAAADPVEELKRCARIADKGPRVDCFEDLGRRVLGEEVSAPTQATAPPPATPAPTAEPPAEPAALPADLGRKKKEKKEEKEKARETYRGHVRACRADMDGIWRFTFDDGQVWVQSGSGRHRFEECDFDVSITKDFFGYKMAIDGGRTLRVRRLR